MFLDSQLQTPLDLLFQHALNPVAVKGRPLFSSGALYPSAARVRSMDFP